MKTLNIMGAREFWASKGKLYPCPNPQHDFKFGRVIHELGYISGKVEVQDVIKKALGLR